MMEEKHFGERFLLSADNLTYQHLFETMAKHLQVPPPRWETGPKLSGLAWRLMLYSGCLVWEQGHHQNNSPYGQQTDPVRFISKVKSRLGMEFRSLEETIRDSYCLLSGYWQDGCHHTWII